MYQIKLIERKKEKKNDFDKNGITNNNVGLIIENWYYGGITVDTKGVIIIYVICLAIYMSKVYIIMIKKNNKKEWYFNDDII